MGEGAPGVPDQLSYTAEVSHCHYYITLLYGCNQCNGYQLSYTAEVSINYNFLWTSTQLCNVRKAYKSGTFWINMSRTNTDQSTIRVK